MTTTFQNSHPENLSHSQHTRTEDYDSETIAFLQSQQPPDKPMQLYARPEIRKGCAWDIQIKFFPEVIKSFAANQIYLEKPRNGRNAPYLSLKVRSKLIKPVRELALSKVATILNQEETVKFNEYSAVTLRVRFTARPRAVFHKHADMMILLVALQRGDQVLCRDEFELIFRGGTGSVHSADSRRAQARDSPSTPQSLPTPQYMPVASSSAPQNVSNQFPAQLQLAKQQYIPPTQVPHSSTQPQPVYFQKKSMETQTSQTSPQENPGNKNQFWCMTSEPLVGDYDKNPKPDSPACTNEEMLDELIDGDLGNTSWDPFVHPALFGTKEPEEARKPHEPLHVINRTSVPFEQNSRSVGQPREELSGLADEASLVKGFCEDLKECFLKRPDRVSVPEIPMEYTIVHGKRRSMCVDCLTECQCYRGAEGPCLECGCFPSQHLNLDCHPEYNKKRLRESGDSHAAKRARFLIKYYQSRTQLHK